jgi:sterol desaturase/sphingolipid hydroxylase (fatty acid hydroxylase superfamily)
MRTQYIVLAIPVFLILILFEYLCSYFKKNKLYTLDDFVNNISTGTLEQVGSAFFKTLLFMPYIYIYDHLGLFTITSNSITMWLILWLLTDFFYYWLHRATHRITFLWAGHSVHHQSEHYNLSVALRQGIIQTMFAWVFYLPIALLGFPPLMFAAVSSLNTLYQFWIHTTLIKRLGFLEHIINTPSHHRVHHGKNPQYIDKNYAGSLMIWDKLFGTFEKEVAPVDYGVTEPLDNWDPFYANIKVLKDTWYYSQPLKNLKNRLLCFIKPPEWIIEQIGEENYLALKRTLPPKNSSQHPKGYLILNIFILIPTAFICFYTFDLHSFFSITVIAYLTLSLFLLGHVMNAGKHAIFFENLRTLLLIFSIWPMIQIHFLLLPLILSITFFNAYLLLRRPSTLPLLS